MKWGLLTTKCYNIQVITAKNLISDYTVRTIKASNLILKKIVKIYYGTNLPVSTM